MRLPGVTYLDDLEIPEADIQSGSLKLMGILRPDWDQTMIEIAVFSGGFSNRLVGCSLNTDTNKLNMVLVRVYGQTTERLVDRDAELLTIKMLHAAGCAGALYAKFKNGIAYEYLAGESVDENAVRNDHIAGLIKREILKMHAIEPQEVLPTVGLDDSQMAREPQLFIRFRNLLKLLPESDDNSGRFNKEWLTSELQMLEAELKTLDSPIVFCHNDLLCNNIVYNSDRDRIYFIDYEYSGFNYQAYDIAFHFAEYAGSTDEFDYSRYPDRPYQLKWIRNFLELKFQHYNRSAAEVTERDVERLYVQVNKFSLATHLYSGLWASLQCGISHINYDFRGYANLRFDEYLKRKGEFIALEMPE